MNDALDTALFLWDFLIIPGHIYILDEEQTVTRPALSGNNIHFSGRHFLRSDEEIPPSIKYVGKKIHLHVFFLLSLSGMKQDKRDIKERNTNTMTLFFWTSV